MTTEITKEDKEIMEEEGVLSSESQKNRISSEEALARLTKGNARFVEEMREHPRGGLEHVLKTGTEGQNPFATILSCSDSRVPLEVIFDQGIGDLFVVRVAGNVCTSTQLGSIKYGVEALNIELCVIMGHTECGAVLAACLESSGDGHVESLIEEIRPAVLRTEKETDRRGREIFDLCCRKNVFLQIETMFNESAYLRKKTREGRFSAVGAIYDVTDGHVEFLGPHPDHEKLIDG